MKNLTWTLAICALAVVSCSKDAELADVKTDPNQINFRTNTSRAAITDLGALESSSAGFVIYGASGTAPSAWMTDINGTNNYKKSGTWGWTTGNPQWPVTPVGYPMKFYAYFASSYTGLTTVATSPTSMSLVYTIQPEASQVDFVAAKATVLSKPGSGTIPLTFNHILSKINFGVIPGNGAHVYLQSMSVNNVGNVRAYDFINENWLDQPNTFAAKYWYKTTTNSAIVLNGTDASELTVKSVSPTYNSLMLMPQTASNWVPTTSVAPTNAYMGVIYRVEIDSDVNSIGYKVANSHPGYGVLSSSEQAALNGKPLFVSVGYPFSSTSTMTWDKGKGYTYNICLGTANATNGYIVDNFYYDENGVATKLQIANRSKGDTISNGQINFVVNVTDWVDQTPSPIV